MKRILQLFIINLFVSGILFGQTIAFTPAGQSSGFSKYNLTVSTSSGVDGSGGFSMSGSNFTSSTNYYIKVSFDGGVNWFALEGGTATTGSWLGNGLFATDANGEMQIAFQHTRFTGLTAWPGNDGTITLRASNLAQDTFYPGSSGSEFTLDLTRPSISTASVSSNNSTSSEYATTGDQVSVTFTSSEDLDNSTYPMTGDISGVAFSASGSGTSWTVSNTVSTHSEGTATFDISFYDENGNLGATSLSTTTDNSTVTIDKTSPTVSASLASNNSTTSLAKTDDIVTLAISSNEILNVAPTVSIDGNSVTPNPNTAASSYSAQRTMASGDTQGSISFSISNIKDRAGNTASNITATTDASAVIFDSNSPTLTGLTISSNNSLNSALAKPDDIVTLTFYSNEECQTPVATIVTEAASESNSSGDQLSWTATKTMDADDSDGTIAFTIDFTDLAGNTGTQATSVISGSNVTFDGTAPTVTSISVVSSNSDATYAVSGDVISVTINTDEALSGISSATIGGTTISGTDISEITTTQWKLSYTVTGSETSGAVSYGFTAVDEAGNETPYSSAGSSVIIDNTAPTLSTVEIASNNTNTSYAKAGDVVTLSITSSEDLSAAPTVFLAGRSASVSAVGGSDQVFSATLTMNSTDTQGAMAISIAFDDLAGNAGTTVAATTNSSSVYYDRQAPSLSAVTVASNNSNSSYAKEGDIITLSFTGSENLISSPTVTIATNDENNGVTVSGTDDTWTATYTMVNGDTEGNVPFTIDYSDLAGNAGVQATTLTTGDLIVYDETVPTLSTVSITSNNANGTTFSKVGDQLTLTVVANENVQTPTITIAGNAATIASGSNGEKTFTATYIMQSSDAATTAVPFTVDFSDLAGNAGTQVTSLTNNDLDGGVGFDKEAPTFTTVSIVSNNSNNTALAKVGDVVTVSLTSDEPLNPNVDPTVTIAGNTATVTRNSTTSFTAVNTMSSSDVAIDGTTIPINISTYSDSSGNVGTTVTNITDGSSVTFDMSEPTLPTITIATNNTYSTFGKTDDVVTLTISSNEAINSPTVSLLGSTTDVTVAASDATDQNWTATKVITNGHTQGTAAFSITFDDLVGNSGSPVSAVTSGDNVTIDRTAPTLSTVSIASNNTNGDELAVPGNTITLTVVSNEDIIEPTITIATQSATISNGGDSDASTWSATYQMTENEADGTIAFSISFSDSAGNAGTDVSSLTNDADGNAVTFDKSKPVLSSVAIISDNSFNDEYAKVGSILTLSFDANEELLSSAFNVTINGNAVTPSKTLSWNGTKESWAASYTMTTATGDNDGAGYTIPFTVDYVDLNGYAGDQVTTTYNTEYVTFDKTAPTLDDLTYTSNNDNSPTYAKAGDVITMDFSVDEFIQQPTYLIHGNTVTDETAQGNDANWSGTYAMSGTDFEGTVTLSVAFKDYAGNAGATQTSTFAGETITFDRTIPTLTSVNISSNNKYSSILAKEGDVVTVTVTASETLQNSPTITISGESITATGSGTDWTASHTMQTGDAEGNVEFNINFGDLAANVGIAVTASTDGSTVTYDETATDLSGVSIDLDSGSDTGASSTDNLTNDTTPTFTITGLSPAATDTLFLVIDGDTMASGVLLHASHTFTSSAIVNKTLPYSVSVVTRDLAGNLSDPSSALEFRLDTSAPSVGLAANLLDTDDSGTLDNDDLTNVTSPQLIIGGLTPSIRDSIELFYDDSGTPTLVGGFRMSQGTIDTFQVATVLTDGAYSFTYFVIDSAGNTSSESTALAVTIDATAPLQPNKLDLHDNWDSGFSNTDDLSNMGQLAFNAVMSAAGDSLIIKNGSGTVLASELVAGTTTTPTVYNVTSTATYYAYEKDPAGNVSSPSDGLTVTIDQTAPDLSGVSIDLKPTSDSGLSSTDNITNDNTPEFTFTNLSVSDSAYFYIDGTLDQSVLVTSASMDITSGTMTDGSRQYTVSATDPAGNNSALSIYTTLIIDTTPLTLTSGPNLLAEDDSGFSSSDDTTNVRQPRFSLSDLGSDLDSISFYLNDGVTNELIVSQRMNVEFSDTVTIPALNQLSNGSYTLTYLITDSAGNASTISDGLTLYVDIAAPNTPDTPDLHVDYDLGETSIDNITSEDRVNIVTTGIPQGYARKLYFVDLNSDPADTTMIDSSLVPANDSLSFLSAISASGNYLFYAVGVDTAGNTSESNDLTITSDFVIPSATITFEGDSLVRAGDVSTTATFVFSEELDDVTLPTVDVDYPEGTANDLTGQSLTYSTGNTWTYAIPLNTAGIETVDGVIGLSVTAADIAGNAVPADSITGLNVLRVDNTTPAFSGFSPDTGSFNNVVDNFGWTLSETVETGSVLFSQQSGPGTDVTVTLDATELVAGTREPASFIGGDPALVDGTIYNLIFTSTDTAGNIGQDTVANVSYDTTTPTVDVTFSQLFVSGDSTVVITATFDERILPTPTISLDYSGNFNDITDAAMTISGSDSAIWTYTATIPTGIENQGNVDVSISATDLATNALAAIDLSMTDTLYVDNTVATATFSFVNTSQADSLMNVGIDGDEITVTVTMNEPLVASSPVPSLNYTYGGGEGDFVSGVIAQSTSNGDSVWVFQISLLDSIHNDGPLSFELIAKDRSNNYVQSFVNHNTFLVDNYHPADFNVGDVTVYGINAVQGWISGNTDSIEVQLPIQTNSQDSTLFLGGFTQIQLFNLTRGVSWVSVGTTDSLTQSGTAEPFYRTIAEIEAAMIPGTDLIVGDSLKVRASITDRYGNITFGTGSAQKLVYDPSAPNIGTISGGVFALNDTLFSNDTLSIQWTEFTEEGGEAASGIERYELAFEKIGTPTIETFYGWDTIPLPTQPVAFEFLLEHNQKYLGHIRAFDIAGNISDTLVTDTLVRYNTAPTIMTLENAVLYEDIAWTDTITFTDPDLSVLQGDSFIFKAMTTRILGADASDSVRVDSAGILTWVPTQDDTGSYEIQLIVTDAYSLADTFLLPLTVNAVNDTPVVDILPPDDNLEWWEDQSEDVKINLTSYLDDVDNNDSTEMTWQAVILDTGEIDLDYPLGTVVVGPGTPWEVHTRLQREYMGFNPKIRMSKTPTISRKTTNRINEARASTPLLSVSISEDDDNNHWAYFNSDSNYYGSEHRVIFIVQDPFGAESRDTIMASILAQNDPPVIAGVPDVEVIENDSIKLEFGQFTYDVDDPTLTFRISALTNSEKVRITPSIFTSENLGDSVLFVPERLWSNEATIQVIAADEESSDTATFKLDVLRVTRPHLSLAVIQNNAFSHFLQIVVVDTAAKTKDVALEIQSSDIELDTIAAYTYSGDFNFYTSATYTFDVHAQGVVGDTMVSESFALAASTAGNRWLGRSDDGRFSVAGDPGAVLYDQPFLIVDSSLFIHDFSDQASYVLGAEGFEFQKPIEVRMGSHRDDLAIYRRENGANWTELPSINQDGNIFTYSEKTGYFKFGPKTIIVPEETNIHQNYPNPFNPTTTIGYDIGLMDGLTQNVSINVYNILGQHIRTLVENEDQIGQFKIQWDGTNELGRPMASGIYFIQLTTETGIARSRKMLLLK